MYILIFNEFATDISFQYTWYACMFLLYYYFNEAQFISYYFHDTGWSLHFVYFYHNASCDKAYIYEVV